jgi:hypothetical protein
MKSVYSAVRTGSLNNAVCVSSFKGQCPSTPNINNYNNDDDDGDDDDDDKIKWLVRYQYVTAFSVTNFVDRAYRSFFVNNQLDAQFK